MKGGRERREERQMEDRALHRESGSGGREQGSGIRG